MTVYLTLPGAAGLLLPQFLLILANAQLNLPEEQELYCAGCEAVINEAHKALSRKSQEPMEVRVMELLDDFCVQDNFNTYDFIPPKMIKACQHLMDEHEEELERLLIDHYTKGGSKKAIERRICNKITDACRNIDKTKKKKKPMTSKVVVDGEEREVNFEQGKPAKFDTGKSNKNRKGKSKREL